ncbi:alkylhydroperoxidase [Streptomyces sp. ERV7]|uniref:carboxymuconolactone decarboxylase family protein n=1 Tax=Streptomyces sp. ERV7 TaxID=1322334 RepID=UPI0007F50866|nr:carboxymuconolactone decarboxylase family protein [Streptomyces sp. ERV7]OAR24118.1 alkylhydroperoxidase [Streptomyces sp. ERV7]
MAFIEHTLESAPVESRRAMEGTVKHLGHLSPAVARLATSPHTLEGFLKMSALFERTTLEPVAREVVIMTVATRNDCALCVNMHTARLRRLGAPDELIGELREGKPLTDERLDAVREFTLAVYATSGAVPDAGLDAFLAQGYTRQNALEVVLGIGTYTVSTFANRLTGASH